MKKEKTYSEKLRSPQWQKKRLEIFKRDKFKCKKCGDTDTQLHVHHKEYIDGNDPWEYDNKYLVTLCEDCHSQIERIKEENPEIEFERIKIHKSDNWSGGSKIIFISTPFQCDMQIFDENGKWKDGYSFTNDIDCIIKIFKSSLYV